MNASDRSVTDPVVRLSAVRKLYGAGDNAVVALDGVTMDFDAHAFTAVMGPSGSGKSTLLHCAAGLDQPSSGLVVLDGVELAGLNETALTKLRREKVGFVFQSFNLLPTLTAAQNVTLPLELAGRTADSASVARVLGRLGLGQRMDHRPDELSGGQQQRVAIARAIVTKPAVVFADEPTGALDSKTAADILALLRDCVRNDQQTVVMVTHDPVAAAYADRVVFLADGQFAGDLFAPTVEAVAERLTRLGFRSRAVDDVSAQGVS